MINAYLQIEGVLVPGDILLARASEGESRIDFRVSSRIEGGRVVVLQTSDGHCLECLTTECTPEDGHHVVELRCRGNASFLGDLDRREG